VEFGWDGPASVSLLLFSIDLVFLCDLGLYGSCPYLYHQAVLVLVVAEREREREERSWLGEAQLRVAFRANHSIRMAPTRLRRGFRRTHSCVHSAAGRVVEGGSTRPWTRRRWVWANSGASRPRGEGAQQMPRFRPWSWGTRVQNLENLLTPDTGDPLPPDGTCKPAQVIVTEYSVYPQSIKTWAELTRRRARRNARPLTSCFSWNGRKVVAVARVVILRYSGAPCLRNLSGVDSLTS